MRPTAGPVRRQAASALRGARAGADPVPVTRWMSEIQAERAAVGRGSAGRQRMTRDEITSPMQAAEEVTQVPGDVGPAGRADVSGRLA